MNGSGSAEEAWVEEACRRRERRRKPKLLTWRVVSTVPGKEGLSPRRRDASIGSERISIVIEDSERL